MPKLLSTEDIKKDIPILLSIENKVRMKFLLLLSTGDNI